MKICPSCWLYHYSRQRQPILIIANAMMIRARARINPGLSAFRKKSKGGETRRGEDVVVLLVNVDQLCCFLASRYVCRTMHAARTHGPRLRDGVCTIGTWASTDLKCRARFLCSVSPLGVWRLLLLFIYGSSLTHIIIESSDIPFLLLNKYPQHSFPHFPSISIVIVNFTSCFSDLISRVEASPLTSPILCWRFGLFPFFITVYYGSYALFPPQSGVL